MRARVAAGWIEAAGARVAEEAEIGEEAAEDAAGEAATATVEA